MKNLLSLLGTITLIGTSTTSLVSCNTSQYTYSEKELAELKEEKNINIKTSNGEDGVLEWIAPQEKPFNKVDNKYYYVVWRGDKNDSWYLTKFNNNTLDFIEIDNFGKADLWKSSPYKFRSGQTLNIAWTFKEIYWENDNGTYFKSVYRWNLDKPSPDLVIDENGDVKIKGE